MIEVDSADRISAIAMFHGAALRLALGEPKGNFFGPDA